MKDRLPAPLARVLDACRRQDPGGFRQLQHACLPVMLAAAFHFLKDTQQSEDVVHDALLLAWLNARRFRVEDDPPEPWLFTILGSRLYSQLDALPHPSGGWQEQKSEHDASCVTRAIPARLQGPSLWELSRSLTPSPPSAMLVDRLTESLSAQLGAARLPTTPTGERVHPPLYDASLQRRMQRSRLAYQGKMAFQQRLGRPLEDWLFQRWLAQRPGSQMLESQGLPRRSIEATLGDRLDITLPPRQLVRYLSYPDAFPDRVARRKVSNQFLWAGDWDLPCHYLADSSRTRFIQDLWSHRLAPDHSETFQQLAQALEQGQPLRSHHKGILLDSRARILEYLRLYLLYMENMACFGFDKHEGKDRLGVAIDRHGKLIKINKGLHRLAMAQVLGLPEVTVRVRCVHRQWWQGITGQTRGSAALECLTRALPACEPT
jgi:hypothetical protein